MTQQRRVDLLSKEVLSLDDLLEIFSPLAESSVRKIMTEIKSTHDRLNIKTVVHVQDYIEHFNLPLDRYIVTVVAERDKDDKIQFYKKSGFLQ